jgi:hypothetical protein
MRAISLCMAKYFPRRLVVGLSCAQIEDAAAEVYPTDVSLTISL